MKEEFCIASKIHSAFVKYNANFFFGVSLINETSLSYSMITLTSAKV